MNYTTNLQIGALQKAIEICQQVEKTPRGQVLAKDDPCVYALGARECILQLNNLILSMETDTERRSRKGFCISPLRFN